MNLYRLYKIYDEVTTNFLDFILILFASSIFSIRSIDELPCRGVVHCFPKRLQKFYSFISFRRKEIVNNCIVGSFFKCRETGILSFLIEHLVDYDKMKVFSC